MPDVDSERSDAEVMRRRLYRPGASDADLASYLHAAGTERVIDGLAAGTRAAAEPSRSRRPFAVGAVCVAGVALIGGLLLFGAAGAPAAAPTTSAAAAAAPSADGTQGPDGSWEITFRASSVLDSGYRSGSEGSAVADGPDRYRYTIAAGDTVTGIAARFALCRADVIQSLPYGFSEGSLPAGGSLELGHVSGLC